MKYFKRSLAFDDSETGGKKWDQALCEYCNYTESIIPKLPDCTKEYLVLSSYHDAVLWKIEYDKQQKQLKLHFYDHPALLYLGVEKFLYASEEELSCEEPDVWLYDEIELLPNGFIEFRVLLELGDLTILASDVQIQPRGR